MSDKHTVAAAKRDIFGKKVNALRKQGKIPGNIYGKHAQSIAVWLNEKELTSLFKHINESTLIELTIESESKPRPVIFRNISHNPFKHSITHIDIQEVNLKEKIEIEIPVELTGESPVVADGTGVIDIPVAAVLVEALPTDLPENFTVDISNLTEVGQHITVADLQVPKGVEILTEQDTVLVSVTEPQKEEVEEVAPTDEAAQVEGVEATAESAEAGESEEKSQE